MRGGGLLAAHNQQERGNEPSAASFAPALRRYFAKRAQADEVEDLVQDVMLRMEQQVERSSISHLGGYVFAVASNVLKERYRKAKQLPIADGVIPDGVEDITPERIVAGRMRMARVLQAIELLPARTRQIFVAHRFEEMSYRAIARMLLISESSVEKHMMAALRSLTAASRGDDE